MPDDLKRKLDVQYDPTCKDCHHFEAIHGFGSCHGTVQLSDNSIGGCTCNRSFPRQAFLTESKESE